MATRGEYYITGDDANLEILAATWWYQTFTPLASHNLTSVKLLLYRIGSPGTVTASIRTTDVNGKPTGNDLCSGTINGNTLTTDNAGDWYEITQGAGYNVVAGTKYAIVVRAPSGDASNMLVWRWDSTSATYTGGNAGKSENSGSTWTGYSFADCMFEEWGTTFAYTRTLSTAMGMSASLSRHTDYGRSLTATALFQPSVMSLHGGGNSYLCVASRDGKSVKTNLSLGTTWTVCAHDTAGRGTLPASFFAQFDNRLCGLNYQNSGFNYSQVNDLVADWVDKPNFPNLSEKFTGLFVGKDASDTPALYFLTPKGMYYLDVFTNFVFGPTEVTWEYDDTAGKKGLYWKGDNYVAVGKGIYKIHGAEVSLVGPDMDDGLPEGLQGTITDMIGVGFWLVIAINGGSTAKSSILKRYINGKHWHPVYVGSKNDPITSLCWDNGTLYFGEGTDVKSLSLPAITDNINTVSSLERIATGSLTYPYFHSLFEAMPKVGHKVWATTKNCNANETISIYYRIDEDTDWTLLGSFITSPRPTALSFGAAGIEFERIQLKAVFARGGTLTNSPKLESLILEYRVVPPVLWGWTVKVNAVTSGDRRGQDIIEALKAAISSKTLLSFYPGGDKDGTEYFVQVSGMPGVEKGTEFGQEGIYQVNLMEVIE